ncbi:MAG TPA: hypothetical protein VK960_09290 [Acidimicrobiia bacterium]|nr:hypothetical protein [Acidimicrobiia bacterium]
MIRDGGARRLLRDVGAATVAFVIVFAAGYLGGRAAMPAFRAAVGDVPLEADAGTGEVSIVSLRADLAAAELPAAVLASTGVVEAQMLLDRGESLVSGLFLPSEDEPEAIDLNTRFTGGDASLTIKADQMAREEARTEGMTIVLTANGMTFNPRAGMCTLELRDFGFTTVQRPWGQASLPWYGGSLTCRDVPELRSGEPLSFTAVFEYRSH